MKKRRFRLLLIPIVLALTINIITSKVDNDPMEVVANIDKEATEDMRRRVPQLEDGIYQSFGQGFNDKIHVQMIVEDGKIQDFFVCEHNEHETNSALPINKIPKDIVETQSVRVDIVSGATSTSDGIIEAARNCIKQAGGNPSDF